MNQIFLKSRSHISKANWNSQNCTLFHIHTIHHRPASVKGSRGLTVLTSWWSKVEEVVVLVVDEAAETAYAKKPSETPETPRTE